MFPWSRWVHGAPSVLRCTTSYEADDIELDVRNGSVSKRIPIRIFYFDTALGSVDFAVFESSKPEAANVTVDRLEHRRCYFSL